MIDAINPLLIALVGLVVFVLLIKALESRVGRRRSGRDRRSGQRPLPEVLPYRVTSALLTPSERSFFGVLQQAVGDRYLLAVKVRLADLLDVPAGTAQWHTHFNRISAKHIDIVCCDPRSLAPLLAIELDDVSHARPDRQDRDEFVDEALRVAGLPLLRVSAARGYSLVEIRDLIASSAAIGNRETDVRPASAVPRTS